MRSISQAFRCFDEVARRGSIRKAAESLHLTPAAVHQQILNFEEQVGVALFDRLPRGMQLTAAGEIVVAAVRRSQRDFDNALSQLDELRSLRRGHVGIAVPHSSADVLMPQVIEETARSYPGLTYSVRTGNGEAVLRWVAQGDVDVGLCLQRVAPTGVSEIRRWPQRLGAVVAPDHPLARGAGPLRLRDCLDQPLALLAPDMELRLLFDRLAQRERRPLSPLVETTSVTMVRRLAAGGSAIGFLVQENVARDVAEGRLAWRPLADADAGARIGLYQRAGQTASVAMGVLVDVLGRALEAIEMQLPSELR